MIEIILPESNFIERKYIIDILFGEYLGLEYNLVINKDINDYHINLENGNQFIIKDHFFSLFPGNLQYLSKNNIPKKVEFGNNPYSKEKNLPILFGHETLSEDKGKNKRIICEVDIFAASFYMLTRWEEYVIKTKEKHNRFSAMESLAKKSNFLHRPIVNEYVEFLWNVLTSLGYNQKRKVRNFSSLITHDVDFILRWYSFSHFIKAIAADIIKKKDIQFFGKDILDYLKVVASFKKDPFDTFDYLMKLSEKTNQKSYFFFMSIRKMKNYQYYELSHPFIKPLMNEILMRGHYIGFHPGFNTCNNINNWQSEYNYLKSIAPAELKFGRQHFLQFEAPFTWQIWDDMKMEWDSTLSFHDEPGFRCGTCYPYSTFNFLTRNKLRLIERPLIIMDKPLVQYNLHLTYNNILNNALTLINTIKKYHGEFVFLWHNNSFNVKEWIKYQNIYHQIICSLQEQPDRSTLSQ